MQLMLDGSPTSGLSLPADLNRGEHKIRIAVLDRKGKEVGTSGTVTIFVHRPSVKN